MASHNTREVTNVGHTQRGGTATLLTNQLAAFVIDSGTDPTGLGRWSWYLLQGEPGVRTYVVSAYAPCGNDACGDSTYYHQHKRFIQERGLKTNPKAMFREDLLTLLRKWRAQEDRVILMMDANEDVQDGAMCKQLRGDDLKMMEAVGTQTPGDAPKTWFRGSEAIDGIWVSSDLDTIGASYLPFDSEIGDPQPVVVDITMSSVLGINIQRVVPPQARRLNSKVGWIRSAYI